MNPLSLYPLHEASRSGDLSLLTSLLAQTPHLINQRDKKGNTPLHVATLSSSLDCLRFLLSSGADPNTLNRYSLSPLSLAVTRGNEAATQILSSHPTVDLSLRDARGRTALHIAALNVDDLSCLRRLGEAGADLEAKDREGRTPIDLARGVGGDAHAARVRSEFEESSFALDVKGAVE